MAQEKLWNKNNQTLSHAFRFNAFCHLTITVAFTTPLLCSYTFTMLAYKCNLFYIQMNPSILPRHHPIWTHHWFWNSNVVVSCFICFLTTFSFVPHLSTQKRDTHTTQHKVWGKRKSNNMKQIPGNGKWDK